MTGGTQQQFPLPSVFVGMHRLEANGDDVLVDQGLACPTAVTSGLALDGDGDLDVVTSQSAVQQRAAGTFVLLPQAFGGFVPQAIADLDDDGDLDFVAARHTTPFGTGRQVELFLGNGGVFTLAQTFAIDGRPLVGDVDGDGTTDLVVATSNTAHVLRRSGPGPTYLPALQFAQIHSTSLADLEQDGDLDLVGGYRVRNRRFAGAAAGSRLEYGNGGLGTGGRRPLLSAVGPIRPGLTCGLRVRRALGGMPAALFFGASAIDVPDLLPGITGYVDNLFASVLVGLGGPTQVPGAGSLDLPLAIPPGVSLLEVYVHALVLDATGPIGLVHSNAIVLHIGL